MTVDFFVCTARMLLPNIFLIVNVFENLNRVTEKNG